MPNWKASAFSEGAVAALARSASLCWELHHPGCWRSFPLDHNQAGSVDLTPSHSFRSEPVMQAACITSD